MMINKTKESFAVIIPDRNDRPQFTNHCLKQISRMTVLPDKVYHIKWPAIDNKIDLVERVYNGVQRAKGDDFDLVFILENDDAYKPDHFEKFGSMTGDFFGDEMTYYYHLKSRTFKSIYHPGRSSLFTTGFRISKMDGFQWSGDQFLDLRLWEWARKHNLKKQFVHTWAIGMKHGLGKCGGKGHKQTFQNCDPEMRWLKGRVDPESYQFYTQLSRKLLMKENA